MCKEMYAEVYKRCDGCVNEEPGQQSHDFCLLVDPVTKATECFNELCFEKVFEMIPISVRDIIVIRNKRRSVSYGYVDIDLYMNREKLEAVVQTCSVKKVFLEISQNSPFYIHALLRCTLNN